MKHPTIESHEQPCGCPRCARCSELFTCFDDVPMDQRVIVYDSTQPDKAYALDKRNITFPHTEWTWPRST